MARIKNRDRLLRKLAALPPAARSQIKQAIAQAADELTEAQRALVPVKTGNLRESIRQAWGGKKVYYASLSAGTGGGDPDLTVTITAGDSDARYAHLVEFGTAPHINGGKFKGTRHPGARARPFFYPPYRSLRKRIRRRINLAHRRAAQSVARMS